MDLQSLLESAQGQDSAEDSDDESQTGLPHGNLTEANLPSSTAALLAMLDKEQRETFLAAVGHEKPHQSTTQDTSPANVDTVAPLQSKERAKKLWEKIVQDEQRRTADDQAAAGGSSAQLWWLSKVRPDREAVEEDMTLGTAPHAPSFDVEVQTLLAVRQSKSAPPPARGLAWNCVSLLTAYTYILLHLDVPSFSSLLSRATSGEYELIVLSFNLLARLCPFLFALPAAQAGGPSSSTASSASSDANLLLSGPSSVSSYLLSRLGDRDRSSRPSQLLLELYTKAASLMEEDNITVNGLERASKAHGTFADIWLLMDCALAQPSILSALVLPVSLGKVAKPSQVKRSVQQASRKLIFYSATCASATNSGHGTLLSSTEVLGKPVHSGSKDALSSLTSLSLEGEGSLRPHKSQREAKTLHEEMEMLRGEVKALEEEERWYAARRLEVERLGGGKEGANSIVMSAANKSTDAQPRIKPIDPEPNVLPACVTKEPAITQRESQKVESGPKAKGFAAKRLARQQREEQSRMPVRQTGSESLQDSSPDEQGEEHAERQGKLPSKGMIQMLD
ncbi:hypothetical protein BCV69DRAFT_281827 [Microstroma glucosiphilum]|uniref:Uncharacterized protein n=1 Tax=Pseudomicrostroma glucosiphilum TaxID=1684307 RepID=A0A316UBT8_9BASI|nr:hypothetical protein BCV69DRAFT_281827 [Pseudomicrostroma glucosiphilum]PWN21921.1 hypothetical protein BCV69DRAFT_281827 [Pseudomicrostroma glucosiphilum]